MDEIHFYCIACGANLSAGAESAGGFCDCPRCLRASPIPSAESHQRIVPSKEILAIEIKFRTACCGNKVRVDARSQGLTFKCPTCQASAQVPVWDGALPVAVAGAPVNGPVVPLVRLSEEEYAFLSAPLREREAALASTAN
jgi:hypothetical protein